MNTAIAIVAYARPGSRALRGCPAAMPSVGERGTASRAKRSIGHQRLDRAEVATHPGEESV